MNTSYKEYTHAGLTVKIYPDEDTQSPDYWKDENLFLVADHNEFYIPSAEISRGVIEEIFTPDEDKDNQYAEQARELKKEYHIFLLDAYIHSGVALHLGNGGKFPDKNFDSSILGAIFASKKEFKTRAQAKSAVKGLIESWNTYLIGDVYGFIIEDSAGNELDALWGNYELENAIAEANLSAESCAKYITKKFIAKKRAEIKNNVPLNRRTTLASLLKV